MAPDSSEPDKIPEPAVIRSPVHLVMGADIDKKDFVFAHLHGQGYAVAVGEANGLHALEFSGQGVQAQAGFKWIGAQLRHGFDEAGP